MVGALLVSLLWYKPGVRLPPRVAIVVQTGGETRVNIHTVKIQVSVVVQTGGKVTCRNSKTARNDSDQLGLDPVV